MLLQGSKTPIRDAITLLKLPCQTTGPEQLNSARLNIKLKKNNNKKILLLGSRTHI